jgi:hypothetical protein
MFHLELVGSHQLLLNARMQMQHRYNRCAKREMKLDIELGLNQHGETPAPKQRALL